MRKNRLPSSKNTFNNYKEFYNEAIHNSSYKNEIMYFETNRHHINRGNDVGNNRTKDNINMDNKISKNILKNRHRNIILFNAPFCQLFHMNIGKNFLVLISKHFKDDNPHRKIINKNDKKKISYSCTNNFYKIIDNHKKLINKLD